jgi:hypothetical protein
VRPSICFLIEEVCQYEIFGDPSNSRQLKEHVDFALVTTTFDKSVHHIHHPSRTLTTRGALAAGLVFVKLYEVVSMS